MSGPVLIRMDAGAPLRPALTDLTRLMDGEPLMLAPLGPNLEAPPGPATAALPQDGAGRLVVASSGSTGAAKRVVLRAAALRASVQATAARLGGHGSWVLTLPPWHIAGIQVLIRSVVAGTSPVSTLAHTFTAARFAQAVAELPAQGRRYTALVPTQLARLLDERAGQSALRDLDAVLVGGGPLSALLRARARDLGAPVVTTYGMTETAGGCVYDGLPLGGVRVRTAADGRLELSGPTLADGYLDPGGPAPPASTESEGDPESPGPFHTDSDGVRWFRTDDLGAVHTPDGVGKDRDTSATVVVHGRADDVIITGGHKVTPTDVDHALLRLPEVHAAAVYGVPHPQWGCVVAAAVATRRWPEGSADPALLRRVRERLRPLLPAYALPRILVVLPDLPMLESGKPDRRSLIAVLRAEVAE